MTTPYITDIDDYTPEINWYYSDKSGGNYYDKYMSKTELTTRPGSAKVTLQITNATGDTTLNRSDIETELTYINGEGIPITYNFSGMIKLYNKVHQKYNGTDDGDYIDDNRRTPFRYSLRNFFGCFVKYWWYGTSALHTTNDYKPTGIYQRKAGLLCDNIRMYYSLTSNALYNEYPLPNWEYFDAQPAIFSGNTKYTDILEEAIRNERGLELTKQEQLLLLNGIMHAYKLETHMLELASFLIENPDGRTEEIGDPYIWFYVVIYADNNGISVLTLLNDAIQADQEIDISPFMNSEHLWICQFVQTDTPLNADRPNIRAYKPYLKMHWMNSLQTQFSEDLASSNYPYPIKWDPIVLDTKEHYEEWIKNQVDRIRKINRYMNSIVVIATTIERRTEGNNTYDVYWVDSYEQTSIEYFERYATQVNQWWKNHPFTEEIIDTVCAFYNKSPEHLESADIEEITGGLCTLTTTIVGSGESVSEKYLTLFQTNVKGTRYPYSGITNHDFSNASERRERWLPFVPNPETQEGMTDDTNPGYFYYELLQNLMGHPDYITNMKEYTSDYKYIYSNATDQKLLMSRDELTADQYVEIESYTKTEIDN